MKKIIKIMMIGFFIIMGITSYAMAATNTYSVNLYPEKTQYKQEETVNIPVKIEDIDIEKGIVAFDTILEYDEDVFENVKIQKTENWDTPALVEHLIQATTETMQPVKENQEIMIISLRVKKHAKIGKTEIGLSKFDVSDTENTIRNTGAAISVEIVERDNAQEENNLEEARQQAQNQKPNVDIQVSLIIVVTAILISILLIVYFIDQKKKEKKEKKED